MDWRATIPGMMVASLLLVSVSALSVGYFDLSGYPQYCEDHRIEEYCNEQGFFELIGGMTTGELESGYVNEFAYSDQAVYRGLLQITDMEVDVEIDAPLARVEARYGVKNTGPATEADLMALRVPANIKAYEGDSEVGLDELYSWTSDFAEGEGKDIWLMFEESVPERIYGYNTNLVIDEQIPTEQSVPRIKVSMRLPEGAELESCVPDGYTAEEADGRTKVVWEFYDAAPWTNPFNDLICTWEEEVTEPLPSPPDQQLAPTSADGPEQGPDNSWIIWVVIFLLLAAIIYWYARVRR